MDWWVCCNIYSFAFLQLLQMPLWISIDNRGKNRTNKLDPYWMNDKWVWIFNGLLCFVIWIKMKEFKRYVLFLLKDINSSYSRSLRVNLFILFVFSFTLFKQIKSDFSSINAIKTLILWISTFIWSHGNIFYQPINKHKINVCCFIKNIVL